MHPFSWVTPVYRWYLLAALLISTAVLMGKLASQGKSLITDAAPRGMLSFQFSWNESGAKNILNSWEHLKAKARDQLFLDYVFLAIYPLFLSLTCGMLANTPGNEWVTLGAFLSWLILLAGPLDAVENYALLEMIRSGASEGMAKVAGWCSGFKFAFVLLALSYIVVTAVVIGILI
ncbi:MAG: hypothetical protein H8K04_00315 [Nitrospira sp.]